MFCRPLFPFSDVLSFSFYFVLIFNFLPFIQFFYFHPVLFLSCCLCPSPFSFVIFPLSRLMYFIDLFHPSHHLILSCTFRHVPSIPSLSFPPYSFFTSLNSVMFILSPSPSVGPVLYPCSFLPGSFCSVLFLSPKSHVQSLLLRCVHSIF